VTAATILELDLPDEAATRALAAELARRARRGDVIGLSGPLGSGKTTFARAFIRARCPASEVPSPTFTLVEIYEPDGGPAVWHFDLYRLERPDEAYELGLEEALSEGIALLEWPERLGPLLPSEHLGIGLEPGGSETRRRVRLCAPTAWAGRVAGLPRG